MAQNEEDLQRLMKIFGRGKLLTARQIAELMDCSRPVAYARVRALKDRGFKLTEKQVREGSSGPMSIAYAKK